MMAFAPRYSLCKYPKTARLAQLLLSSPIVPIEIRDSYNLKSGEYSTTPYVINKPSNEPIPEKVYRDLQINVSASLNDWLISAAKEAQLDERQQEVIDSLRSSIADLAKAGLGDQPITQPMMDKYETSQVAFSEMFYNMIVSTADVLGIPVVNGLSHALGASIEINNMLKREKNDLERGRQ